APDPTRPITLAVYVTIHDPSPDGFPKKEELPRLAELGRSLDAALSRELGARAVGRATGAGERALYYYVSSDDRAEEIAESALASFSEYDLELEIADDPEWKRYRFFLYPGPLQVHQMRSRRIIEQLRSHGDSLVEPRVVSHWLYFETAADRERFVSEIAGEGFVIADRDESESSSDARRFGLTIEREDSVDVESIHELTLLLFEKARNVNGDYDGWGAQVVPTVKSDSDGE